jgi:endo-1,4-beta-xylanase
MRKFRSHFLQKMLGVFFKRLVLISVFSCMIPGCISAGHHLRDYADKKHLSIGAAVVPDLFEEKEYAEIVSDEFNMLVPEYHLKWSFIHPERDSYNFSDTDKIIDFAEKHNSKIRGHTLVWHESLPAWITSCCRDTGHSTVDCDSRELEQILKSHIQTVVSKYKGRIYCWDVVNEPLSADVHNGNFRGSLWLSALGQYYIEQAFYWAHEADRDAKLFLNDTNIAEINSKSDFLYSIVKKMREKGVPIDGIGFQFHLDTRAIPNYESIENNIQRFLDLGLEIQFTEIDVSIWGPVTGEQLEIQADIFRKLIGIALRHSGITAFVTWGVTDKYSWLTSYGTETLKTTVHYGSGLLFDEQYRKKPSYFTILNSLKE